MLSTACVCPGLPTLNLATRPSWHIYQRVQRFVTVSARRVTVWDGKTGEALTTLTAERLLENDQADITAFSLDHQVDGCTSCSKSIDRELMVNSGFELRSTTR